MHDPQARLEENQLRDAFMAFWRGAESDQACLREAYSEAQERYDAYLAKPQHNQRRGL